MRTLLGAAGRRGNRGAGPPFRLYATLPAGPTRLLLPPLCPRHPPAVKVRCQAQGTSAAVVLAELRAMGFSAATLRTLYAGCGSAALCSAVIGAFYLLAFYTVKRLGSEVAARHTARRSGAAAAPSAGRSTNSGAAGSGSQLADGTAGRPPLNAEGTHPLVASLAGVSASVIASVFEAPSEWRRRGCLPCCARRL